MTEHAGANAVKKALEAYTKGDPSLFTQMIADDVVWHVPGEKPLAGVYHGQEVVSRDYLQQLTQLAEHQGLEVHDVFVGRDGYVIPTFTTRYTRKGKSLVAKAAYVYRLQNDKIVEARLHLADLDAWNAFWSD